MLDHEGAPCSRRAPISFQPEASLPKQPTALPRVWADTGVGVWSQRCGWVALPSNMQLQSLCGCHLAGERVRDKWNCAGISSYKRSHSELPALLYNKGTRRWFMPLKGTEHKIKGRDFLCFVFWVMLGYKNKQQFILPHLGRKLASGRHGGGGCTAFWAGFPQWLRHTFNSDIAGPGHWRIWTKDSISPHETMDSVGLERWVSG